MVKDITTFAELYFPVSNSSIEGQNIKVSVIYVKGKGLLGTARLVEVERNSSGRVSVERSMLGNPREYVRTPLEPALPRFNQTKLDALTNQHLEKFAGKQGAIYAAYTRLLEQCQLKVTDETWRTVMSKTLDTVIPSFDSPTASLF